MKPYTESVADANVARSPDEVYAVLQDVLDRLREANSAIAVDSAANILQIIVEKGPQ